MSREVDSEADDVEASKEAEHALENGERGNNRQSTRPPYGSRHDALISVLLHTLHPMSRCLIAILILDELKAVAGKHVEAVDTGPIVTPRP